MASRSGRPQDAAATAAKAVGRSAELVTQASGAATEFVRQRRDPAAVAGRRRRRARRAAVAYGVGGLGALVFGVTRLSPDLLSGGSAAPTIVMIVVLLLVAAWCAAGVVRSVRTGRRLDRELAALPAPRPARRPVDAAVRPAMQQLDGYSDGLRQLVGLIGATAGPSTTPTTGRRAPAVDASILELRRDILAAADSTERHLRQRAADLSGVLRARSTAPAQARPGLEITARSLAEEIRSGVDEYGRLVTAAGETVAASRALAQQHPGVPPQAALQESTDRLRALAAGMRELSDGRPG